LSQNFILLTLSLGACTMNCYPLGAIFTRQWILTGG
jgi:hypothetical protein